MNQKQIGNLLFFQADSLKIFNDVMQAVSTRIGGVSPKPFDSLNLSFTTGDNVGNVLENRRRMCQALGVKIENLTLGRQVHGCNVKVITDNEKGRGGVSDKNPIASIDGMLTDNPETVLMALSADCPLVLCYDPEKKAIAVIHASWRGSVEGVCARMIKRMRVQFGSQPKNIHAVISPSIGPCCYEVKKDFIDVITTLAPIGRHSIIKRKDKTYFDLWSFNRNLLHQAGVWLSHIEASNICTKCHPEWFYSFRRDGAKTGRFGAIISLKKGAK
jgi:YfiH family protein